MDTHVRFITDHIINPANDLIRIAVTDAAGAGGANHRYIIDGIDLSTNESAPAELREEDQNEGGQSLLLLFQNGPIAEKGVNGITQEVLLAIIADRLRSFQVGPFACRENALALTKIEEAMHWLQQRTLARMRRGVEGTNKA